MNPALAQDPRALRVNLTVPTTAIRVGPFTFDGLKALLGVDLADVLGSMMIGPKAQREVLGGVIDVYSLAIPPGDGLSIPVKLLGEIGFYNFRGALMLVVPPALADVVKAQFASELAAGTAMGPGFRAGITGATVAEFAVALRPGMRKAVPLGGLGELGVEAA